MTLILDRRSLIVGGTLGIGVLALPGAALAQALTGARGFTHHVASGEPASDSMLLWTRYVAPTGDSAHLTVELSETPDFARIAGSGAEITGPWRDWTAKITVRGLRPGTRYHYRFVAADGTRSPVGTTKTLPDGPTREFRAAIFSCSNMTTGWFNAYGHAAARDDLDCAIHLGDYFYEYAPPKTQLPGRPVEPLSELLHLADYRLRYASYRADPDLQALHAKVPWIVQWDDHESANDSWEGGAGNHQPATEGDWNPRRAAAVQAYREWMPVSDEPWKAYDIGTLATLWRTETRVFARTRQNDIADVMNAPDPAALARFRDASWHDPAVTMMGTQQEAWLFDDLKRSVRERRRWQVVGFGTIMGNLNAPSDASTWLSPDASESTRGYILSGVAAGKAGLPWNLDSWGGYPAARARFLAAAEGADAELVVLCGDSHNAWAFDLAHQNRAAGVEFAGTSVTSRGLESAVSADPALVARELVATNPELKWCDTSRRGYMALTITPDRVSNDWLFVDTLAQRRPVATVGHRASVPRGRRRMIA